MAKRKETYRIKNYFFNGLQLRSRENEKESKSTAFSSFGKVKERVKLRKIPFYSRNYSLFLAFPLFPPSAEPLHRKKR